MLGDLFKAGANLIGGAGKAIGSFFGAAGGAGAMGGGGLMNVAMNIFGGSKDDPWGVLDSPVTGHVLASVGQELLRPDPVEERLRLERGLEADRRKRIRGNYGLPAEPTAAKYMGNGLMRSRGLHTPPRRA